jgi:type I restriction enzyme, S subunit
MPGDHPYYGANGLVDHVGEYLFDGEHVLLAEDGGHFDEPSRGVAYRVDGQFWVNNHAHILRPEGGIPGSFVERWLNAVNWMPYVSGTTRLKLTQGGMNRVQFPLPPLPEQQRIVAKLDRLSARSRAARDHLARTAKLAARAKQAILAAAFRGDLTAAWRVRHRPDDWRSAKVGDLVERVRAGKNLKCEERPPIDDERGVVKVSAVTWGSFDPRASKTLPPDFDPGAETLIRSGDLLFSRANTIELVGACVIVEEAPTNLYLSDKILRLEVAPSERRWLMYFLRSPAGRAGIEGASTGNQLSMRNISQKALAAIQMPWPPSEERREIVRHVEAAFARIDRMTGDAARAAHLLDRLDERLLAKAFRGELVPQDPADEPAEALLARIRAARAQAPARRRGRKARA